MRHRILPIILLLLFSGCSLSYFNKDKHNIGKYNFNYKVEGQPVEYISQVFDNGKETYFQLGKDLNVAKIEVIVNQKGKSIPLLSKGRFVAFKGLYQKFYIALTPITKKGIPKEVIVKVTKLNAISTLKTQR